jgi:hypothetical protein
MAACPMVGPAIALLLSIHQQVSSGSRTVTVTSRADVSIPINVVGRQAGDLGFEVHVILASLDFPQGVSHTSHK